MASIKQKALAKLKNNDIIAFKDIVDKEYIQNAKPHITDLLLEAVKNEIIEIIRYLLNNGINPDVSHGQPLKTSIKKASSSITALLIEEGANPNTGIQNNNHALAVATKNGKPNHVKALINTNGPNTPRNGAALIKSKSNTNWPKLPVEDDASVAKALAVGIEEGGKVKGSPYSYFRNKLIRNNRFNAIKAVVETGIEIKEAYVKTAIEKQYYDLTIYLIEKAENLNGTAYTRYVRNGSEKRISIANQFKNAGVDPNNSDALSKAIKNKDTELVNWILNNKEKLYVSEPGEDGLFTTLEYNGFNALIANHDCFKWSTVCKWGQAILNKASQLDIKREVITFMLERYKKFNVFVDRIINDFPKRSYDLIRIAFTSNKITTPRIIVENNKINAENIDPLLCYAAIYGYHDTVIDRLVCAGAKPRKALYEAFKNSEVQVDVQNKDSSYSSNNKANIVSIVYLFNTLFDINWGQYGDVILTKAVEAQVHPAVIGALDRIGVSVSKNGKKALNKAEQNKYEAIKEKLINLNAPQELMAANKV